MFKHFIIIIVICSVARISFGQEMNGAVHSNYSGITGALINPSSIVNSKLYRDVTIIGGLIHVDNNYIYLAKDEYKFKRFFTMEGFPEHPVPNGSPRIFYDRYNTDFKNGYLQARIFGPSFMYSKNDRAIGLYTSFRNIGSLSNVPYEIAKFAVESFHFVPQLDTNFVDTKNFRLAGASLAELSATYAQVIYKHNRDHLSAGITLKGMLGLGGGFWFVDNVDYIVQDDPLTRGNTLEVNNANGKAAISGSFDYVNNKVLYPNPLFTGSGLGLDIGITYQVKLEGHTNDKYEEACRQPYEPYRYRIGLSLIDIGYLKFKKNLRYVELEDSQTQWEDFTEVDIDNLQFLINETDSAFSNVDTTSRPFNVYLPTAASVQFDFMVNEFIYINTTIVQPIVMSDASMVRPSQISLTPRYESDHFELSVPITIYEYKYPRIGLSARMSNIIVGTDKLGGFFGLNHFTGLDFYFMIKLHLIKGNCRGKDKVECGNMEYNRFRRNSKRLR